MSGGKSPAMVPASRKVELQTWKKVIIPLHLRLTLFSWFSNVSELAWGKIEEKTGKWAITGKIILLCKQPEMVLI